MTANVTLAVFGAALVFLVLWQDLRRRSNLYFALCMAIFAAYGTLNTVFQVAQQAGVEPEPVLQMLTTLYVAGLILLFSFVLTFAGMPRRDRWKERAVMFLWAYSASRSYGRAASMWILTRSRVATTPIRLQRLDRCSSGS
jgi:hypothetical protein